MELNKTELEEQNEQLKRALRAISESYAEIGRQIESISDLLKSEDAHTSVTSDDVKSLLKKYSRLGQ